MMESKELRIGNLINLGKVIEISEERIIVERSEITSLIEGFSPFSISGIPLTEDWLLKFGFVNKDKWFYKTPFVLGYITADNVFQYEIKISGSEKWILKELQYVHQLQNLYFALSGEELTLTPAAGKNK